MKALRFAIAALLVATACTDSGPKGLDPTVLVRNQQSTYSPVTLTWYDQSGQVQFDSFASGEERCVHFTSTLRPTAFASRSLSVTRPARMADSRPKRPRGSIRSLAWGRIRPSIRSEPSTGRSTSTRTAAPR
jgi:hypothetical protein